jgi:hypothetical protein
LFIYSLSQTNVIDPYNQAVHNTFKKLAKDEYFHDYSNLKDSDRGDILNKITPMSTMWFFSNNIVGSTFVNDQNVKVYNVMFLE